jgi:hypothetical protein
VLDRVIQYLGDEFVDNVVRVANLHPSKKLQHLDWLNANLDPANPEHRKHIAALPDMSTVAMSNLKRELQGKSASTFAVKGYKFTAFDVLSVELERHVQYRPELHSVLESIQRVAGWKYHSKCWSIQAADERALFDLLHGKSVSDVQDAISALVDRIIPVIPDDFDGYGSDFVPEVLERIPAYAPIKFTVQKDVVQTAPVKVLAALSIMLDSETPDIGYTRSMVAPVWEASPDLPPF